MSLRQITLLIAGFTAAACIVAVVLISGHFVMGDYEELERAYAEDNVRRALNALADEQARINIALGDWAYWDDTKRFVAGENPGFPDVNLMDATLDNLKIDMMFFFAPDGRLVHAKCYRPAQDTGARAPRDLLVLLAPDSPFVRHPDRSSQHSGLALTGGGVVLLASLPILDSNRQGPVSGALVMGRYVDSALIGELARKTRLDLAFFPSSAEGLPAESADVLAILARGEAMLIRPESPEIVSGYALLRDVAGRPAFVLRVSMGRDIVLRGRATLNYNAATVAAAVALIGLALFALVDRRILSRVEALSRQVAEIGRSGDMSWRVEVPGRDELARLAGDVNAMLGALERSEASLRESEARHRAMFESHRAVKLLIDPEAGRIVDANPAAAEYYGYSRKEMQGMPLPNICVFSQQERVSALIRADPGGAARFECSQRLARGEVREVTVHTGPVEDGGRRLIHAVVFDDTERRQAEDALQLAYAQMEARVLARTGELHSSNELLRAEIAEREEAEAELRESEERLRHITGSAYDAILQLDAAGRVSFANPAALRLFGREGRELIGIEAAALISGETFGRLLETGETEGSGTTLECLAETGAGVRTPVELSVSVASGREGREAILVVRDVSVRRAAEEALQRAKEQAEEVSRLKSEFITMLSHEMRTPMTSILGFAKMIRRRLNRDVLPALRGAPERAAEAGNMAIRDLGIVVAEGERLTDLMSDVLDLARLEADRVEWRPAPVDLAGLVLEVRDKTEPLIQDKGLAWAEDLEGGLPWVVCDRGKILQVLMNLLSNAVKFTPQGQVRVSLRREGDMAVAAVADTGIGIAEADMPRLFGKFVQLSDTLTDKPRGTGLGLSICKHIVEMHGGRIWAESEAGRGSTFSFALPLAGPGEREAPAA